MPTDIKALQQSTAQRSLIAAADTLQMKLDAGDEDLSPAAIIGWLRSQAAAFAPATLEERSVGQCENCSRPLTYEGGDLYHLGPDGRLANRGCRAASYVWRQGEEGGWDESLDRGTYPKLRSTPRGPSRVPSECTHLYVNLLDNGSKVCATCKTPLND